MKKEDFDAILTRLEAAKPGETLCLVLTGDDDPADLLGEAVFHEVRAYGKAVTSLYAHAKALADRYGAYDGNGENAKEYAAAIDELNASFGVLFNERYGEIATLLEYPDSGHPYSARFNASVENAEFLMRCLEKIDTSHLSVVVMTDAEADAYEAPAGCRSAVYPVDTAAFSCVSLARTLASADFTRYNGVGLFADGCPTFQRTRVDIAGILGLEDFTIDGWH